MKNLSEMCVPDPIPKDTAHFRCQPNRTFVERPIYDDVGNIVGYEFPRYDPNTPPSPADVTEESNFDLKDPSTYANVILGNEGKDVELPPAYDAFTGTQAVENVSKEFKI